MKMVLLMCWLGLVLLPARAEDWATADGKVYKDVQVLSHNVAYVTILDKDGGGRIPLATLKPELQKRFGYDPAKAPAIIKATQAADQRDKEALAKEKKIVQAQDEERLKKVSASLAAAYFAPVPDTGEPAATDAAGNSIPANDRPISSEPATEINDWDYSDGGWYDGDGGYSGYNYGYGYGYGHRRTFSGRHFTHGSGGFRILAVPATPRH